MARGRISTICHHGAPIRVPKRRCIPLQQPNFAQPLSKWVKNSDAFLKLSYKTFFVSTNLVCCQVMYIEHLSPWGPPKWQNIPLQQPNFAHSLFVKWHRQNAALQFDCTKKKFNGNSSQSFMGNINTTNHHTTTASSSPSSSTKWISLETHR